MIGKLSLVYRLHLQTVIVLGRLMMVDLQCQFYTIALQVAKFITSR